MNSDDISVREMSSLTKYKRDDISPTEMSSLLCRLFSILALPALPRRMKYVLLGILFTSTVWAQTLPKTARTIGPIAPEALQADFRVLREALTELHPSLYRYTPKATLDSAFDQVYRQLQVPLTEREFINRLYPAVSLIRCGHTQLEPSLAYRQAKDRPRVINLPVQVLTYNNRLFVVENRSNDAGIETGAEILSINGVSTNQLIGEVRQLWSSDGFNQTWVDFFINNYGLLDETATFLHGWRGTYTLNVRHTDGTVRTATVTSRPPAPGPDTALSRQQIMPIKPVRSRWQPKSYLSLRIMHDSTTALLTVNGLEYGDETFYQQVFRQLELKRVQNLILDIRRNHGGDGRIISQLFSYLADGPYRLISEIEGPVAYPERSRFRPYYSKEVLDAHRASFQLVNRQGGGYRFMFRPENGRLIGYLPVAKANRFRGNLYVLIDGGTFSNGANFAAALKAQRANTTFIGRETGGTEVGCNGGTVQRLTLPHTQIVVQFPWLRLVSASPRPDTGHGLLPDVPITLTPRALADSRDQDLEAALGLIAKE